MTRLFDLDIQLLHDTLLMALAVGTLFFALSYLLFDPIRALLADRHKRIEGELSAAKEQRAEAQKQREKYRRRLREAAVEAETILREAEMEAECRREEVLRQAEEQAAEKIAQARESIRLEREQAAEQMRREMISIAAAMAAKAVTVRMDEAVEEKLLDETLREMEAGRWRR